MSERNNPGMDEAAALIGELLSPVMDLAIGQRTLALRGGLSPEVADQMSLHAYQTALSFIVGAALKSQKESES